MIGKKAWPRHSNDSRKPKSPHGSFPNYRPVTSGIRASREFIQGDRGAHQLVKRMSNEQLASVVVDERAPKEPVPNEPAVPKEPVAQSKTRGKSKKRDASSDAIAAIDEKLTRMRTAMLEFIEELDEVKRRINEGEETLRHEFTNVVNRTTAPLFDRDDFLETSIEALKLEVVELKEGNSSKTEVEALKMEVQELKTELILCKASIANGALPIHAAHKLDVPKPKEFKGNRSAKEVDNFLWSMGQYFDAIGIQEDLAKVRTASMFLVDNAMLWWRNRCEETKRGTDPITTWDGFVEEFRDYFFPGYAQQEARSKLHRLEQRGTVREYVNEFTELKLQIPNLGEEEALGAFMDGLKPWALLELKRRDVKSLSRALVVAESLADFTKEAPKTRGSGWRSDRHNEEEDQATRGRKDSDISPNRGRRDHGGREKTWGEGASKSSDPKWKQPQGDYKSKFDTPPPSPCFICNGPHWTQKCPKKSRINAILAVEEDEDPKQEKEKREVRLGTVKVFNSINSVKDKTPPKKPTHSHLSFVEVKVNGVSLLALVDTGASSLFLSNEAAKHLGLHVEPTRNRFKMPNSDEIPGVGVAKNVKLQVGTWEGKLPFEVIPLDDYDLILGLEFFDAARAMIDLRSNVIIITDSECPSIIPMITGVTETKVLSTIRRINKEPRVDKSVPKLHTQPKPKVDHPLQHNMPIHVLFPEVINSPTNMEKAKSKEPNARQTEKPKVKKSRKSRKRSKKTNNPKPRAPRTSLE